MRRLWISWRDEWGCKKRRNQRTWVAPCFQGHDVISHQQERETGTQHGWGKWVVVVESDDTVGKSGKLTGRERYLGPRVHGKKTGQACFIFAWLLFYSTPRRLHTIFFSHSWRSCLWFKNNSRSSRRKVNWAKWRVWPSLSPTRALYSGPHLQGVQERTAAIRSHFQEANYVVMLQ